uniref:Uncharacterized protein n=1 Tax=Oreochromis aureus TaxID=47969 RepID=A0AAZ1XM68_OREAU
MENMEQLQKTVLLISDQVQLLNESRTTTLTCWFSKSSAQSRVNFCTEKVFPTPATPLVRTTLMGLCWSGKALKMSWHLIGVS